MSDGERRLAAVMFTDIVGYTKLMQENESATVGILRDHRELIRPLFASHGGREIKTIGDAFLVEFGSALDATLCAIAVQSALYDRKLSRGETLDVRIGIHVGDVIESKGDIIGDAVNVASRIESLAEPGGVCISGQVYDQVRNKIPYQLVKAERRELKNVREPVDIYRVMLPWEKESAQPAPQLDPKRIAVLPFVSMSPDPNDEYFADGLTEELTDGLCRVKGLAVIARTSTMKYKQNTKGASEIGRELRAGSLVEGSVRKSGNRIRVTAQLVNANTDEHLWSSKYDRDLADVFAVQADIAGNVANALQLRLVTVDGQKLASKGPRNPQAHEEYLRGLYFMHTLGEQGLRKAIQHFAKAIELEPNYAASMAGLSTCYSALGYFAYEPTDKVGPKAKEIAMRALELDESIPEAHDSIGLVLFFQEGRWEEAGDEYRRALELNPNLVPARINYAWYLSNIGRDNEALVEINGALDLDPLSFLGRMAAGAICGISGRHIEALGHYDRVLEMEPDSAIAHNDKGLELCYAGRTEEGIKELEKSLALSDGSIFFKGNLGWAYGISGRKADALRILDELKQASIHKPISSFVAIVYAGLGEKEEALDWLEKACLDHTIIYNPLFTRDPAFANLREEQRFKGLVQKLGLDKYLVPSS